MLRTTEQSTLLNAATAYMNLLQTAAILELQRSNVNVLEVTLRQTRDRFTAGEVTRTDVAQVESRLAAGRSQLSLAESNYVTAQAQYQQVIGVPAPATPRTRRAGRSAVAAHARWRDRPWPYRASADHDGDLQRRHRSPAGQGRGGRALSHPVCRRHRAEDLRFGISKRGA